MSNVVETKFSCSDNCKDNETKSNNGNNKSDKVIAWITNRVRSGSITRTCFEYKSLRWFCYYHRNDDGNVLPIVYSEMNAPSFSYYAESLSNYNFLETARIPCRYSGRLVQELESWITTLALESVKTDSGR